MASQAVKRGVPEERLAGARGRGRELDEEARLRHSREEAAEALDAPSPNPTNPRTFEALPRRRRGRPPRGGRPGGLVLLLVLLRRRGRPPGRRWRPAQRGGLGAGEEMAPSYNSAQIVGQSQFWDQR